MASGQVNRQFVGVVVPFWPDNAIQFGGPATRPTQTVIDTSDVLGLNLASGAEVEVDGLPAGMTATVTGNGEAGVFPTVTLSGTPTQPGLYPLDVVITAGGVSLTQVVTLVVTAPPPPPAAPRPRPPGCGGGRNRTTGSCPFAGSHHHPTKHFYSHSPGGEGAGFG